MPGKPQTRARKGAGFIPATGLRAAQLAAGDLIFVNAVPTTIGRRLAQGANLMGQRVLVARRSGPATPSSPGAGGFSHVMLGIGPGLVIHADGRRVALDLLSDVWPAFSGPAASVQVYRKRDMDGRLAGKVALHAKRYLRRKYSFIPFFGDRAPAGRVDTTMFCSRLVAYAFREAGAPLTALPDHKVLPADLVQICRRSGWDDITAGFAETPIDPSVDEHLPGIEIPGEGSMTLSAFFARTDAAMAQVSRLAKETEEARFDVTRELLESEALMSQFVAAMFDYAKQVHEDPALVGEHAAGIICRTLGQLSALLQLSLLPAIDLLVFASFLNADDEEAVGYVGQPGPSDMRTMQEAREALRIYTALLFAKIGLMAIVAHLVDDESFAHFRSIRRDYAERFLASIDLATDISAYANRPDLFAWSKIEGDREFSLATFRQS